MDVCNIGDSKAQALMSTIQRLAQKYFLIENLLEQGKTAADQWLNCTDGDHNILRDLVIKYENVTMFDLGIEGVNEAYDAQQQALYSAVGQSVGKLRRRALLILLVIGGITAGGAAAYIYLF